MRNALPGRVVEVAESGPSTVDLRIAVGAAFLIARITRAAVRDLELVPGRDVVALVKGVAFEPDLMASGPRRVVDV